MTSEGGGRVALPASPADLPACFRREFPEIPARTLTKADVVRIIGSAKVLDRAKSACGERAVGWIDAVEAAHGKSAK